MKPENSLMNKVASKMLVLEFTNKADRVTLLSLIKTAGIVNHMPIVTMAGFEHMKATYINKYLTTMSALSEKAKETSHPIPSSKSIKALHKMQNILWLICKEFKMTLNALDMALNITQDLNDAYTKKALVKDENH